MVVPNQKHGGFSSYASRRERIDFAVAESMECTMLIISRRQHDRIVFPSLGITVEVLKLGPKKASLGVVAPKRIRVLRHELAGDLDEPIGADPLFEAGDSQGPTPTPRGDGLDAHQLDSLTSSLRQACEELSSGDHRRAHTTLTRLLGELEDRHHQRNIWGEVAGDRAAAVDHVDWTSPTATAARDALTGSGAPDSVAESSVGYAVSHASGAVPTRGTTCVLWLEAERQSGAGRRTHWQRFVLPLSACAENTRGFIGAGLGQPSTN
jgi:sRNA-binding carbon storage regulator CsrA